MTLQARCPSCGHVGRVPDEFIGRKVKCRGCERPFAVKAEGTPAERVRVAPDDAAEVAGRPASSSPQPAAKACPFCGEDILAVARKCKHCGEALDPTLRAAQEAARAPKRSRRDEDDEDDDLDDEPRGRRGRRRRDDDDEDDPRGPTVVVSNTLSNTVHVNAAFPHLLHIVLCVVTCGTWLPVYVLHAVLASRGGGTLLAFLVGVPVCLALLVVGLVLAGMVGSSSVPDATRKMQSSNNLRQLAGAMQRHMDANQDRMPPAAVAGKDGRPLLSWRVALLPALSEEALYRQFKLDEPWDSAHNRTLLARMPAVFAPPPGGAAQPPDSTFYQVFTGKGTPFEAGWGPSPHTFADGMTSTFLIVEAGRAVPWTKPEDLPYAPQGPLPALGGLFPDGFTAVMADGTARFVRKGTPEATVRAYITPAGAEVIQDK